jgi:hypothetical protein
VIEHAELAVLQAKARALDDTLDRLSLLAAAATGADAWHYLPAAWQNLPATEPAAAWQHLPATEPAPVAAVEAVAPDQAPAGVPVDVPAPAPAPVAAVEAEAPRASRRARKTAVAASEPAAEPTPEPTAEAAPAAPAAPSAGPVGLRLFAPGPEPETLRAVVDADPFAPAAEDCPY